MLCYHHLFSFQDFHSPDSAVFSVSPAGAPPGETLSAVPCWDLMSDTSPLAAGAPLTEKRVLLSFSPGGGTGSCELWSLPAVIKQEFPRQSVAVPTGVRSESGFCTRYCMLNSHELLI